MEAIYLRKSRADMEAEQHGDGETLARHERTLLDLAKSRGLTIGRIYREIITADNIADRPAVQELLADVSARKYRAVLVMDADRLARGDTIDQGTIAQAFKFSQTLIITPYKTYDPTNDMDEEFFEFGLFMARREYKTIKRRLQAGRMASAKEGKFAGSRPPYGYRRVKLTGQKGWSLEIVPEEAEIVRMVFDLYVSGVPAVVIADKADALGARSMFGRRFDADYVRSLLRNINYIGYVRWNTRVQQVSIVDGQKVKTRVKSDAPVVAKAVHEPIIDEQTFARAGELLTNRRTAPVKMGKQLVNPLAGLVVCARCGRILRQTRAGNGWPLMQCPNSRCDNHGAYREVVESTILDTLREWQVTYTPAEPLTPPTASSMPNTQSVNASMRAKLEQRLDTLKKQRDRLYTLLEQDVYTIDVFTDRSRVIAADISAAEAELAALDAAQETRPDEPTLIRNLLPQIAHVLDAYPHATTPKEKQALLATVISQVIYDKSKHNSHSDAPGANMSLKILPVGSIVP